MAGRDQMLAILRVAEEGLAALAADAGKERAYAHAAALLDAARRIQRIGEETQLNLSDAAQDPSVIVPSAPQSRMIPSEQYAENTGRTARKLKKDEYPKFYREGNTLIKVGWSKSERSEYEHKCPKRVLDVLVAELTRLAGPGRRFVMDNVLPLRDPDTGSEFSTYQPYLALALLRQAGLVEQHGRSGYSIPKNKTLAADVATVWVGIQAR